jgi:hypothetical protein
MTPNHVFHAGRRTTTRNHLLKNRLSVTIPLILFSVLLGLALQAGAVSSYLSQAEGQYPNIVGSKLDSCSLCHTIAPTRNPYGTAFGGANHNFATIASLDSDGDGFSNAAEIAALTFPGNAADKPVTGTAPTLSAIVPNSGTTAGGTAVTLTGTNLAGASVSFSGAAAASVVVNAGGTSLTAVTPAHAAGAVSVTATTAAGTSSAVTYTYVAPPPPAPTLGSIAPASGTTAGGTAVTLTGANLAGASVSFGGSAVSAVVNAGGTSLTAVTPAHAAGAVSVTATTASGTSGAVTYTYVAPTPSSSGPTLTALSPSSGSTSGGTTVTLTGTNLAGARVYFGGLAASVIGSSGSDDDDHHGVQYGSTSITVQTPRHSSGRVSVTVRTSAGTSNALAYTYVSRRSNHDD